MKLHTLGCWAGRREERASRSRGRTSPVSPSATRATAVTSIRQGSTVKSSRLTSASTSASPRPASASCSRCSTARSVFGSGWGPDRGRTVRRTASAARTCASSRPRRTGTLQASTSGRGGWRRRSTSRASWASSSSGWRVASRSAGSADWEAGISTLQPRRSSRCSSASRVESPARWAAWAGVCLTPPFRFPSLGDAWGA